MDSCEESLFQHQRLKGRFNRYQAAKPSGVGAFSCRGCGSWGSPPGREADPFSRQISRITEGDRIHEYFMHPVYAKWQNTF
jgi:hypothetical protein